MQRLIRYTLWGAAGVFLLVLALRDLQLDRTLDASVARFDRATPYLSTFGPNARVARTRDGVRVVGEPVYVYLRIPRWFRRVTVEFAYENPAGLPEVRFGPRTHPTSWAFDLHPISMEGSLVRAELPFTLQRSWQTERNEYQFLLSAPGANAERPIVLRSLRVTATRDPVCVARWCV